MANASLRVRALIRVERFLFPILLPLVIRQSVPTLTSTFLPVHPCAFFLTQAMTVFRVLTVAFPPTLIATFAPALPRTLFPVHPGTFDLIPTEPIARNTLEKSLMSAEALPDGNLVFPLIARNQPHSAGAALKRNPEPFRRKPKVLR